MHARISGGLADHVGLLRRAHSADGVESATGELERCREAYTGVRAGRQHRSRFSHETQATICSGAPGSLVGNIANFGGELSTTAHARRVSEASVVWTVCTSTLAVLVGVRD